MEQTCSFKKYSVSRVSGVICMSYPSLTVIAAKNKVKPLNVPVTGKLQNKSQQHHAEGELCVKIQHLSLKVHHDMLIIFMFDLLWVKYDSSVPS